VITDSSNVKENTKLELTWILLKEPEKSYHAPHRVSEDDILDNILIYGGKLLDLKTLEQG